MCFFSPRRDVPRRNYIPDDFVLHTHLLTPTSGLGVVTRPAFSSRRIRSRRTLGASFRDSKEKAEPWTHTPGKERLARSNGKWRIFRPSPVMLPLLFLGEAKNRSPYVSPAISDTPRSLQMDAVFYQCWRRGRVLHLTMALDSYRLWNDIESTTPRSSSVHLLSSGA